MYVCVCIVCISVYCMNMCVLYVLLVYTCIACICMDGLYCVYSVYLHVSACIVCIRNFVCMCMYCLYMSVYLKTFFQIHTHTCTYIHTYNTYKIQICCKCMYVYVFLGKYIHHTDSLFHIQTNTNMQVPWCRRGWAWFFCIANRFGRTYACHPIGLRRIGQDALIQVYCWGIVHTTSYHGLIVWALCVDCAVQYFNSMLHIWRCAPLCRSQLSLDHRVTTFLLNTTTHTPSFHPALSSPSLRSPLGNPGNVAS